MRETKTLRAHPKTTEQGSVQNEAVKQRILREAKMLKENPGSYFTIFELEDDVERQRAYNMQSNVNRPFKQGRASIPSWCFYDGGRFHLRVDHMFVTVGWFPDTAIYPGSSRGKNGIPYA